MAVNRKNITLTRDEIAKAKEFAVFEGTSLSALFREWTEIFLEHGSEYVAPETDEVQVVMDRETAAAAEAKARSEYGCSLRDILRYELSQLDPKP